MLPSAHLRLATIGAAYRLCGHVARQGVMTTARLQRVHQGKRRRKETVCVANSRGLKSQGDGFGQLYLFRSRMMASEGAVLCPGPAALEILLHVKREQTTNSNRAESLPLFTHLVTT